MVVATAANMGDLIGNLIEAFAHIWHADARMRQGSLLGGSELDRRSRRATALICGGAIGTLILGGLLLWWLS